MGKIDEVEYWVPQHVRDYLREMGFQLPLEAMEGYIRGWHEWMQATGSFYDYRDSDGFGRVYEVHRRSIHPAMRVCREWGSLLLNDKTQVVCESQECTDWLADFFARTGFFPAAQATVVRAFGMGTGAWALWIDADRKDVRIRRYDARMVIPLSWDEEQVTECAFVTRAFYRGKAVDQLQLHLRVENGAEAGCAMGGLSPSSSPSSLSQSLSPSLSKPSKSLAGKTNVERVMELTGLSAMGLKPEDIPWRDDPGENAALVEWLARAAPLPTSPLLGKGGGTGASPSTSSSDDERREGLSHGETEPSSPSKEKERGAASPFKPFPTYKILTVLFDEDGNVMQPEGVCAEYDTGCPFPTFALVKPAVENTRVDMSPYGQSIFADAVDAVQAVDLAFDAMINEVDVSKMRVFLSDVLFDKERDGKKRISIPFGKQDCTVFRKVMSSEDMIQEFAPALRTGSQIEALRIALQTLGDLCGLGLTYFDFDGKGYVRTATEVSSDNSALMRNIARHEHVLEQSIAGIARALLHIARGFGVELPDEGAIRVDYDDSIITDKYQEKRQDLSEVGVTMTVAEFRQKWYSESEDVARERAAELAAVSGSFR